jgi:hypothetical protein
MKVGSLVVSGLRAAEVKRSGFPCQRLRGSNLRFPSTHLSFSALSGRQPEASALTAVDGHLCAKP